MTLSTFQKITLGVAGITALSIGGFILTAPLAFYASYGITLVPDASLLSEVRAPAAGLAVLGAVMLSGLVRPAWTPAALVAALTVYLGFPAGRLVSLAVDGVPSSGIMGAFVIEVTIAALIFAAFRPWRSLSSPSVRSVSLSG